MKQYFPKVKMQDRKGCVGSARNLDFILPDMKSSEKVLELLKKKSPFYNWIMDTLESGIPSRNTFHL